MPEAEIWMSRARSALREADTLLGGGFAAASVSRSYYAMFYAARALLSTKGASPKSHGGTLQKLGELFVRTGLLPAETAAEMGATMEMREQADYEVLASAPDEERARQALDAARRFVSRADALLRSG